MDPRELTPAQRKDMRSDLMKKKAKQTTGEKVNACPFGCTLDDLDNNGYCDHLVGFTNDKKGMEPMIFDPEHDRRNVKVAMVREGKNLVPKLEPCLKGDKFVQISTSYRVYRNVDRLKETA